MKSYTDLEQSKKLAEILPVESADMCYSNDGTAIKIDANSYLVRKKMWQDVEVIPCWSLVALLDVLPSATLDSSDDHHYRLHCNGKFTDCHNNSVDTVFEMILKLYEQNIL